jgi:hypothetical protein
VRTVADTARFQETIGPLLHAMTRAASTFEDAYELEAFAAALLPLRMLEAPELIDEALAEVDADADAYPLLRAMAVATPAPIARAAAAAADRAAVAGGLRPLPPGLGILEPRRGLVVFGTGDDNSVLAVECARPGASTGEIVSLMADHARTDGAICGGGVIPVVDQSLDRVAEAASEDGLEAVWLTPAEARDRAREWIRRSIDAELRPGPETIAALLLLLRSGPEPADDDLVETLALLDAYDDVHGDEEDAHLREEIDALVEDVLAWADERALDEERGRRAADTCGAMARYRVLELDDDPVSWDRRSLSGFLLDWAPRKLVTPDSDVDAFLDSVRDVLAYLGERGFIHGRRAEKLIGAAAALSAPFSRANADRARWSPSKAIVTGMLDDGVDITDRAAVAAWIAGFNELPVEERDAVLGPTPVADADAVFTPPPVAPAHAGARRKTARKAQRRARKRNRGR